MDLDETALKAEIDRISIKIDDIMQKINRLYPQQELKSTTGDTPSKNTNEEPNSP